MKKLAVLLLVFSIGVFGNINGQKTTSLDSLMTKKSLLVNDGRSNDAIVFFDSLIPTVNNLTKAKALLFKGTAHRELSQYDKAIQSFLSSLALYEDFNDKIGQCKNYAEIGIVYSYKGDIKSSKENIFKSLKLAKSLKDSTLISKAAMSLTFSYDALGNIDSCIYYSNLALGFMNSKKDPKTLLALYSNLSVFYFRNKNFHKAEEFIKKHLSVVEKDGPPNSIANSLGILGMIYSEQNKNKQAQECFEKAYEIAKSVNDVYLLGTVCEELYNFNKKIGNCEKALHFNELQASYYDSIVNKESAKKIEELNATYQFDKLHKESEIKDLEVQKKSQAVNYLVVIAAFTLLIVIVIGFGYIQKKKANGELQSKNKIIAEKNSEIMDSIHYAQKIQETILPRNVDDENKFILFQPKDVVSGDFYWYKEAGERMYIAAADCTGHGVPGALMSIINNEILNTAVENHNLPCNILSHVNDNLLNRMAAFQRQDGMDIGLIMYDKSTKTLYYSGAKRPLYLVRNGVLTEYKGTKFSIGGSTPYGSEFEMNVIKIEEGDCFYVTTDGFCDQFGGTNNKKYSTKKFKEFLTTIFALTAGEQRESLRNEIRFWKGNTEQTDDICVIGLKF